MKLFEDSFTIKGKTYIREYDGKKSQKRLTNYKSEYYLPDSNGEYRGFLDNVPLRKVSGSAWNVSDTYGELNAKYVAIREENLKYNKDPRVWHLDIETKVGSEFPKPENADQEISCIQFLDTYENKVYLLTTFEFKYKDDYNIPIDYDYLHFNTEIEMIDGFLKLFKELDPFIIYAWGGDHFDFPYIYNRLKMYGKEKKLSNYGSVEFKTKVFDNGQVMNSLKSDGHYFVDMLDTYKKFVYKNVSDYKLDTIAEIEISEKKVDYSNYNTFKDFYEGNYRITGNETVDQKNTKIYKLKKMMDEGKVPENKIADVQKYIKDKSVSEFLWYAIKDAIVLKGIHDKIQFTKLMMSIGETMGTQFKDIMGTLQPWAIYIGNTIYKDKKVLPPSVKRERENIVGGYVKDPIVGKHSWVYSLDFTSLYPNLMRAYNLSPEKMKDINEFNDPEFTELYAKINHQNEDKVLELSDDFWEKISEKARKYNVSVCFGGAITDNNGEGFIPELVGGIFKQRKIHKKLMLKYKDLANKSSGDEKEKYLEMVQLEDINQQAQKILINALYGAIAHEGFILFHDKLARSITGMGRLTIKITSENVSDYMSKAFNYPKEKIWVYGDTDSAYLSAIPIVEHFNKKKTLSHEDTVNLIDGFYKKKIQPVVDKTIDQIAGYTNAFQPEVQGADREVIGSALFVAKKKYTMLVYDNEGVRYTEDSPYIKTQGLEIIKGGTPKFAKKYLYDAVPILLKENEDGIRKWFDDVKNDFMNWKLEDIAKTQGVSKISDPKWGTVQNGRRVSIPFGSRVAIASNNYITKHNLQNKFQLIQPGDKVKMLYLIEPNPLHSNAFAFLEGEFAELFRSFVDYDTNFEKFFLSPLEIMTEAIGINLKNNTESLDDW